MSPKIINKALVILEDYMNLLASEERYEEASDIKAKIDMIKKLFGDRDE